jgi:hypothetical protein
MGHRKPFSSLFLNSLWMKIGAICAAGESERLPVKER